jgi:DUF971 family protein
VRHGPSAVDPVWEGVVISGRILAEGQFQQALDFSGKFPVEALFEDGSNSALNRWNYTTQPESEASCQNCTP